MLTVSDSVVKEAYSMMILDPKKQKWMSHEDEEISYLITKIDFASVNFAYDLGCGIGRHSISLAKQNIEVLGIDYVQNHIKQAEKKVSMLGLKNVSFAVADCRNYKSDKKADLVFCLYDVIGTFASREENYAILRTAYVLLKFGGYAIFSVMNYESTAAHSKHHFRFSQNPDAVLSLNPSNIMETTGNIFSSDYCLVDDETHIVYRKEQFIGKDKVPKELIVRDMRFTIDEIESICLKIGFKIIEIKCTNASNWKISYPSTDKRAKEILVVCEK